MSYTYIEELAKSLLPMAETMNAGETLVTTEYNDDWDLVMGFRRRKKTKK